MSGTIKMTPEELRTTASELVQQKEQTFDILTAMKNKIDGLDWTGTSQQKFVEMFNEAYNSMRQMLEESVTGISDALRGGADTLEQVDESLF